MAIEMKQSLKMQQSLVMTPQLQQAIKLLQLSRLELENVITKEMMENPVLEEGGEPEEEPKEAPAPDRQEKEPEKMVEGEDSFDWQSYVESYNPSLPGSLVGKSPDEGTPFENVITKTKDLHEHLQWQVQMARWELKEEEQMALVLVGNINDDGYLRTPLQEIATKEGYEVSALEKVLKKIQEFDPIGVGARDLRECLMAQAKQLPVRDPDLETLIQQQLQHLERKSYDVIARAMKLPMEKVVELSQVIFNMEPRPGRAFSNVETQYITPDVFVTSMNGQYVITLNEDGLPKLKISNFYKNVLSGKEEGALTKEYIQEKLRSAIWLIRSIHQRQRTIYKVTESIVNYQKDFLDHGILHLKPMVLRDVARDINMHESTISRVTTNKYVHTPQGIFELKYFFNSSVGLPGETGIATESIKEKIRKIVAAEDVKHPYSDQNLVDMLKAEGITVARRTVAKYREVLNILPSSRRKKFF
ncbi:MAG: RNA polymerase factor sigma-54 [Deltaproteobacteria bacterium]|nr:RNA polymerase factor sigma-54 [Deltaproteobacteria bacterium]